MAEGNWNQPDPSGPAWASQTDYYQGAYESMQQRGAPQAPPPPNPKELRRQRRGRKFVGLVFSVLAVWFAIASISYAVTGAHGYLIAGLIFAALFALIARWGLRTSRRFRALEADAEARLSAPASPVAR
jgi:hypothetical protein